MEQSGRQAIQVSAATLCKCRSKCKLLALCSQRSPHAEVRVDCFTLVD